MPAITPRNVVPYPNTDTVTLNDVILYNISTFQQLNYTLYTNFTLSNDKTGECWLAGLHGITPPLLLNTTGNKTRVVDGTSCYTPIRGLQQHGTLGIVLAILFALSFLCTVHSLRRHVTRQHISVESGGRTTSSTSHRQWYWLLLVTACGTISGFMAIDVDRYYLPGLPLVLQSVFYYLMLPMLLAAVWESVHHWTLQQQIHQDQAQKGGGPSSLPLLFYLSLTTTFLLSIPRNWDPLQRQRSPEQTAATAQPVATDARFRAAAVMTVASLLVICYSLAHSIMSNHQQAIHHYRRCRQLPWKFKLVVILLAVRVGYALAAAFRWEINPFRYGVRAEWLYGLGYLPVLLAVGVMNVTACLEEDYCYSERSAEDESGEGGQREISERNKLGVALGIVRQQSG